MRLPVALYPLALLEWTGTGLFLAVSTIYFVRVVGLGVTEVGAGLAIAGALAMVVGVGVGRVADRYGVARMLVASNLLRAVATAGYLFVSNWWTFLLVTIGVAVAEQASPTLVQSLVAARTAAEARVRAMSIQRTLVNVGISVGGLVAGLVLGADSRTGYRWLLVAGAATYAGCALAYTTFREETPSGEGMTAHVPRRPPMSHLLTNRRLILFVAYNGMLSLWMPVLNVAMPIWVVEHTHAPPGVVGFLYATNTVLCIVALYPLSPLTRTSRTARRGIRAAGCVLAVSCLLLAVSAGRPTGTAVVLLGLAVVALTAAELLQVGASWTLSFAMAPDDRRTEFLALFGTGRVLSNRVAGPLLMTGVVLTLGGYGWLLLGVVFVAAALVPASLFDVRIPSVPATDRRLHTAQQAGELS